MKLPLIIFVLGIVSRQIAQFEFAIFPFFSGVASGRGDGASSHDAAGADDRGLAGADEGIAHLDFDARGHVIGSHVVSLGRVSRPVIIIEHLGVRMRRGPMMTLFVSVVIR